MSNIPIKEFIDIKNGHSLQTLRNRTLSTQPIRKSSQANHFEEKLRGETNAFAHRTFHWILNARVPLAKPTTEIGKSNKGEFCNFIQVCMAFAYAELN